MLSSRRRRKKSRGSVTLKLYKGNVTIGSRASEYSLYRTDLSSFTMGESYDQKDAEGFIRILGLPARSRARLKQQEALTGDHEVKMWSGRFRQPLDPHFEEWQRSFPFDQKLLHFELAASRAHAQALQAAGICHAAEYELISAALDEIGKTRSRTPATSTILKPKTFIILWRRSWLALIGETGKKLHSGRSRNEQIATDLRLFVRDTIDNLASLGDLLEALLARAEESKHRHACLHASAAGRTGADVTLAAGLFRDVLAGQRAPAGLRERVNQCPLGSGAIAGAPLALDRDLASEHWALTSPRPTAWTQPVIATSSWNLSTRSPCWAFISAAGRKSSFSLPPRNTDSFAAGSVRHRQQRHAAEAESGCAGIDPRKVRAAASAAR